jgi:hypothetical protein
MTPSEAPQFLFSNDGFDDFSALVFRKVEMVLDGFDNVRFGQTH